MCIVGSVSELYGVKSSDGRLVYERSSAARRVAGFNNVGFGLIALILYGLGLIWIALGLFQLFGPRTERYRAFFGMTRRCRNNFAGKSPFASSQPRLLAVRADEPLMYRLIAPSPACGGRDERSSLSGLGWGHLVALRQDQSAFRECAHAIRVS